MIAFRTILKSRNEFDADGVFVAIKFDVLRDMERQTYFNFDEPTRLRMYRNGVCIIDDYSTTSHPPNESESQLWSLPYMQAQIVQLQTDSKHIVDFAAFNYANINDLTSEINEMKDNPVPVYYTYVQYPNMPEPGQLWPSVKWLEITSRYAGLFFRAAGGSANCFNCTTQEDISPRITGVEIATKDAINWYVETAYNTDEASSNWIGTAGQGGAWMGMRFKTKHKEVIPRNKSIRIWERSP